ncbi:putative ribonuclease H-like domain-containing protein [Tanacetum coccineum]|uniref:Ribonuclease H-like domain-containing protein n=1 Tax=Tanacetum coccineum TaxID=301880 RepID=A0ABQ4XNZ0_9ASTR
MPIRITFDNPIDFNDHFSKPKDLKKDLTISFDSTTTSILPHPLLDSDSPFTAELSASVTLNSLGNEDKVFKPGILVYHAIHDKNLVTLEENLKENISSGTLLVFKEPSFLLPPPEPPDECLKNVVLNFYQSKKTFPLNVEDVNSFTFIIWTFLPFFTYTKESPLIFSFRNTDISKITRKQSKSKQARTRESEEYKKKPKNQSRSQEKVLSKMVRRNLSYHVILTSLHKIKRRPVSMVKHTYWWVLLQITHLSSTSVTKSWVTVGQSSKVTMINDQYSRSMICNDGWQRLKVGRGLKGPSSFSISPGKLTVKGVKLHQQELVVLAVTLGFLFSQVNLGGDNAEIDAFSLSKFPTYIARRRYWTLENSQNNALAKLPMLKLRDGNSWVPIPVTAPESGPSTTLKMTVPSTAEEKICKKNDVALAGDDAKEDTEGLRSNITPPQIKCYVLVAYLLNGIHLCRLAENPDYGDYGLDDCASSITNINTIQPEVSIVPQENWRKSSLMEAILLDMKNQRACGYRWCWDLIGVTWQRKKFSKHGSLHSRFGPTPLDLSYSGLEEFKQFEVEKKTVIPTATKKECVKPVKPVRRSVSCPKHMAPRAVLMKTGLKTVNTSRPVNIVRSINTGRPFSTARPFQETSITRSYNQNVNTGRQNVNTGRQNVNTVKAKGFNAVKPSACWVWRPIKPNGASLVFNKYKYIDARGAPVRNGWHWVLIVKLIQDPDELFRDDYVPVVAGTISNDFASIQGVFVSSTSSQQDQANQDCILMPIWKDASYFDDASPRSVVDDSTDQVGYIDEIDDSEKAHDDSSLRYGMLINKLYARLELYCSREVSTAVPEVNTTTSEDLVGPSSPTEDTQVEDQEIEVGNITPSYEPRKDERGIVIRNKARLVAQGHTQEEGIDYDEVFAPVARIEAIRIFMHMASYMGFNGLLKWMSNVKSAFLYGQIEEEVYVCQPPGFEDPDHPNKVYKVVKALYGLHQAPRAWYDTLANYLLCNGFERGKIDQTLFIKRHKGHILLVQIYVDDIIFGSTKKELCDEFEKLMKDKFQMSSMGELTFFLGLQVQQKKKGIFISQDKYVHEILRKFNYSDVKSASTPTDLEKPLVQDGDAADVDEHLYRSMIGSLMYLTASRPDIMFAVCACARFQVSPKSSHLLAVKRIFRYLKGKPSLGLWYSKDSPLELVAYTDSDYAGATQDRKSTTGGCQFLGNRLISWQCKKQTVVATSTTEAEYVAAASCCGQKSRLWLTIDGHSMTITEASLRRHLKLDDQDGITSIPNSEIFEQLALMGYHTESDKLNLFKKGAFSPQWRFLISQYSSCLAQRDCLGWEQFSSNIATAVICLATNRKYNFSRMIFEHMVSNISSPHKFLMYPRFIQICLDMQRNQLQQHSRTCLVPSLSNKVFNNMKRPTKGYSGQEVALFPTMLVVPEPSTSPSRITSSPSTSPEPSPSHSPSPSPSHSPEPSTQHLPDHTTQPTQPSPGTEQHISTPHDSPLHAVHSHGSDEGSLKLTELTNLVTKLSDRVAVLEDDLKKTKKTYSSAFTKLILRVKKLEARVKIGKARKRAKVVLSEDDEDVEDDSSKQGRKLSDAKVQEKARSSEKGSAEISTAGATKGTASEVLVVSTAEKNINTAGRTVTYSRRSEEKRTRKDKGKAIMTEFKPKKKSKKELEQERLSFAEAIRLEEQMNEE